MTSPAPNNAAASEKNGSPNAWLQGIFLGILIGAAFAVGWVLAMGGDKSEPRERFAMREAPSPAVVAPALPAVVSPPAPVAEGTPPVDPVTPPPAALPVPAPELPVREPVNVPVAIPEVPVVVEAPKPPRPATLAIITEPGAEVLLIANEDVRALGTADQRGQLAVSEPMVAEQMEVGLFFQHPQCEPVRREGVVLRAGETVDIVAPLKAFPGSLAIVASPPTAEVWLNGEKIGRGFVMLGEVPSRVNHTVEVRAEKSEPVTRQVSVRPKETSTVRLNIEPTAENTGDLLLIGLTRTLAAQTGALVKVDGQVVSAEDGLIRHVAPGEHTVSIELEGASPKDPPRQLWEKRVRVDAGAATSLIEEPSIAARPAADEVKDEGVRLALTLLDEKARVIRPEKVEVSFNGAVLSSLPDGRWPVPLNVEGLLTVKIPGYGADARPVHFTTRGDYTIVCLMTAAGPVSPPPAGTPARNSWQTRVLAVSEADGVLVLAATAAGTPAEKQRLNVVATALPDPFIVQVAEVGTSMIVCEIIPTRTRLILPEVGAEVTVTIASLTQ